MQPTCSALRPELQAWLVSSSASEHRVPCWTSSSVGGESGLRSRVRYTLVYFSSAGRHSESFSMMFLLLFFSLRFFQSSSVPAFHHCYGVSSPMAQTSFVKIKPSSFYVSFPSLLFTACVVKEVCKICFNLTTGPLELLSLEARLLISLYLIGIVSKD